MEEQAVRAKVREVLQAGKLPNRRPDRTWAGPASVPVRGLRPAGGARPVGVRDPVRSWWRQPLPRQVPRPRSVLRGVGVRAKKGQALAPPQPTGCVLDEIDREIIEDLFYGLAEYVHRAGERDNGRIARKADAKAVA